MTTFRLPRWGWMLFVALLIVASLVVVFRLGNQASAGVQLSDPVVWVEDGARGRILQINGSTREVTAAVDVGENGDSIVAIPRGRDAVFLNRTTGQLGVVGAISLAVDSEEEVPGEDGPLMGEQLQILANLRVSSDAYILDSDRVLVFEPGAGEPSTIRTSEGLGSRVVDAEGRLVAVTVDSERLIIKGDGGRDLVSYVDLAPPLGPDAEPPALARAGDGLYVVDAARRTVNEVVGSGKLGSTVCVAGSLANVTVGGNVLTKSTGRRLVLVHDADAGVLSVSDVDDGDCFRINLGAAGGDWGAPVAVDTTAYLPNYSTGEIVIVDLDEGLVLDTVTFLLGGGREFELEVFDGAVWANEPQGTLAAIITRDEIRSISKIRNFLISENSEAGGGDFDGAIVGGEDGPRAFEGDDGNVTVKSDDAEQTQDDGDSTTEQQPGDGEGDGDGDDPGDDGEATPDVPDLRDSPVLVDVIDQSAAQLDELVANFVFSASTVNVGEEVTFSDESTGDPSSWNWDFGDGTGAEGPDVVKVWDNEGVFTVTLFVTNERGEEAQQSLDVTVVAVDQLRVPSANFTFRSATIEVGETIEFTDASTGEPETLIWSFGDGDTASGPVVSHVFTEPGSYEVSLTASNAAGPNTTSAVITVVAGVQPPEAIIGRFPGVVEAGQTVTLTSESTNSPTAISWGFGDGNSALGTTVRHAWKTPGRYTIVLSVSNSAAADQVTAEIIVNARLSPPTARFGQSSLEVVQGESINFNDLSTNNPTTLTWEFGDGSTAQGANVSHSWEEPGSYRVTLRARNDAGSDEESKTVTVIPLPPNPPTAAFTVPSATVPVNAVVNFTNTSTGDPTEFLWDFDDGSTSTAASPPHGFATPGTYEVTLTATNAGGSDSVTRTIVVVNPPTASFTRTVNELVVTFADTTSNNPTAWQWDFGDGTSSAAQNPTKTYAAPGTYTVTLISSNDAGASAPFSATVQVASAPIASFTFVTGGLTAQFTDTSTETPAFWSWDFGDGTTSNVQSPTHTYTTGGTYNVVLTVSNVAGSDDQTTAITVQVAPPVANIVCSVVGGGVACDGTGSTGAVSYAWTGAGAVASSGTTTSNASFTYASSGAYDITLTVLNSVGTPNTATQTVNVTVTPPAPVVSSVNQTEAPPGSVAVSANTTGGSPTSWSWTVAASNEGSSTLQNPTFTFGANGNFPASVTVSNAGGTDTFPFTINVNNITSPPVVAISNDGQSNGVISASATATNTPVSWNWTVSPAASISGQGTSSVSITAPSNGSYTVTATATNAGGADSDSFTINVTTVVPDPPVVTLSNNGQSNGVINASAAATNTPVSWNWTVSPAASISGQGTSSVAITAPSNGSYTVTATATNAGGTDTKQFTINVTTVPPPTPTANFSATDLANGGGAQLTNTSTTTGTVTYVWNFTANDPGATGSTSVANPVVTFSGPGTYNVTLTVTDSGGSDSTTKAVTVT